MKSKKLYGKLLIAFLILMLILTYVSSQIYTSNLPKVRLDTPQSGTITNTYDTQGIMEYKVKKEVTVPVDCTVEEIEAEGVFNLNEHTAVASFNMEELLLAKYDLEIQIENYETQMTQYGTDTPQYKRLVILKQNLEEELVKVDDMITNDGKLVGGDTGTIIDILVTEGQQLKAGDPVLTYIPAEGNQLSIKWTMTGQDALKFFPQDDVVVAFNATVETSAGRERLTKNKLCTISTKKNITLDETEFEIILDQNELDEEGISYSEGAGVSLRLTNTSFEYETVVPVGAVDTENSCVYMLQEVKKGFRTEQTVVSVPVRVLMQNDELASITGIPEGEVIVYSDQPIYDGDVVNVLETD